MKRLYIILVLLVPVLITAGCRKPDKPKAIVTVTDLENKYVEGATVTVYSSPNGSIIEDVQTTNEAGQTLHEFNKECILNVKVHIVRNNQNLDGTGLVILKEGETYYETIQVK
jgi:hypothetical protein